MIDHLSHYLYLKIREMHVLKNFLVVVPQRNSAVTYCPVINVLCAQQVVETSNQVLITDDKNKINKQKG